MRMSTIAASGLVSRPCRPSPAAPPPPRARLGGPRLPDQPARLGGGRDHLAPHLRQGRRHPLPQQPLVIGHPYAHGTSALSRVRSAERCSTCSVPPTAPTRSSRCTSSS